MNEPDFNEAIEAAARAAREREAAREAEAAAKEEKRLMAKAAVDSAMSGVVKPTIDKALRQLGAKGIPCENGNGTDRMGNTILTLRLRIKEFPPALVFTADTSGPNPRMTWHEELGHSVKDPRRTEIEEPEREAVAKVISDFLMRAM